MAKIEALLRVVNVNFAILNIYLLFGPQLIIEVFHLGEFNNYVLPLVMVGVVLLASQVTDH